MIKMINIFLSVVIMSLPNVTFYAVDAGGYEKNPEGNLQNFLY